MAGRATGVRRIAPTSQRVGAAHPPVANATAIAMAMTPRGGVANLNRVSRGGTKMQSASTAVALAPRPIAPGCRSPAADTASQCLDDYVAEDNPVRVVDVFIDELDLRGLAFPASRFPFPT